MQISKFAFAFDRDSYKDHIWEFVWGGLKEYYKAEIAKLNNYETYVFHWEEEVETLIDDKLHDWILAADIKGTFNRATAIEEAIKKVEAQSSSRWTAACNTIAKQLQISVNKLKLPDKQQLNAAFFLRVRENAKAALEEI